MVPTTLKPSQLYQQPPNPWFYWHYCTAPLMPLSAIPYSQQHVPHPATFPEWGDPHSTLLAVHMALSRPGDSPQGYMSSHHTLPCPQAVPKPLCPPFPSCFLGTLPAVPTIPVLPVAGLRVVTESPGPCHSPQVNMGATGGLRGLQHG